MTALLEVRGVTKHFRGLTAVDDVSFDVAEGQIFAVIGPNGAGKTTLFNLIAGVFAPDGGTIAFAGERSDGVAPHLLCRRGLARTFQIVRPFPELTVLENATIGAMMRAPDVDTARARAIEVLRQLDLLDRRDAKAKSLTLPDRKRLECARALATEPRLLLLDEVMAGLRPTEVDRIVAILKDINRSGVTILLIEHVMRATMALADRIHVLHHGATIAEGTPDEVTRHPKVLESYLGAEAL
ncbi:ABC transporter ATP-binding protein [Phreatobacter aquaticus]|uniref:ABC transporter ATP-binding protein n=1 Tax=Phreatobacter aquaticus TaxID=2570229 RepID=A0A4D7QL52_9HYPH|nr:ABC transporter ATP-binding protein [Phreatobacter aquaticus]QCK86419.1 ABC transporter ATP-binding protein [Phreatobacter aquaticus]